VIVLITTNAVATIENKTLAREPFKLSPTIVVRLQLKAAVLSLFLTA